MTLATFSFLCGSTRTRGAPVTTAQMGTPKLLSVTLQWVTTGLHTEMNELSSRICVFLLRSQTREINTKPFRVRLHLLVHMFSCSTSCPYWAVGPGLVIDRGEQGQRVASCLRAVQTLGHNKVNSVLIADITRLMSITTQRNVRELTDGETTEMRSDRSAVFSCNFLCDQNVNMKNYISYTCYIIYQPLWTQGSLKCSFKWWKAYIHGTLWKIFIFIHLRKESWSWETDGPAGGAVCYSCFFSRMCRAASF